MGGVVGEQALTGGKRPELEVQRFTKSLEHPLGSFRGRSQVILYTLA